jgi:hypothetical protein
MENLDALESYLNKLGEVRQSIWARMGQHRDALGIPDGCYGLTGGEHAPFHIGRPAPGQEPVEGLLETVYDPLREQSPGDVEPADRSLSGYTKDLRDGNGYPKVVQTTEHFFEPLCPLNLQGKEDFLEGWVFPVDKVAQDMGILIKLVHREFDSRDDLDLELGARLECVRDSGNGVMVGEGDRIQMAGSRLGNDLSR